MPFYSFLPILSVLYEASEGAKLSLQKLIDISLSLESAIKHVAVIQNEFKHLNEAVSKIIVQNVLGLTIYTIQNYGHLKIKMFT